MGNAVPAWLGVVRTPKELTVDKDSCRNGMPPGGQDKLNGAFKTLKRKGKITGHLLRFFLQVK